MEITKQTIKLYDMKFNGRSNIKKIKQAYGDSIKKWVLTKIQNPDNVQFSDIVVPLRGVFEGMPLYVKDTAGLRQWHDDKGNVAGESRFFMVETLHKDTEEPTGLVFKLPVATLREL